MGEQELDAPAFLDYLDLPHDEAALQVVSCLIVTMGQPGSKFFHLRECRPR